MTFFTLSERDFVVLTAVFVHGPCVTTEIERAVGIRKSAAHRHLVKLQSEGLIVGEKAAVTGRSRPPFAFRITDEGLEALQHVGEQAAAEKEQLAQLTALVRQARGTPPRLA